MNWELPSSDTFWKATEIYLSAAYDGAPSAAVKSRLQTLRMSSGDSFYESSVFEATPKDDPVRLGLRLGNRWYPHMKLMIERSPDGHGALFRADTHDRHIQVDASSREYAAFRELMEKNQSLASQIETAWEANGLATFKGYLRQDLARRQALEHKSSTSS